MKPDAIKAALEFKEAQANLQANVTEFCQKLVADGVVMVNTVPRSEWHQETNVYEIKIWNKAIKAVLNLSQVDEYAAKEIRKLKK